MIRYPAIGLQYTRTCPLSCGHCITNSSPQAKGKMTMDEARAYLSVIPDYSDTVCFTGGEPLLYWREIVALIRYAKDIGLRVSLVTGAGWLKGPTTARRVVKALAAAGLGRLCISWDEYHEEFSARQNAVTLAEVATDAGVGVTIRSVSPSGADPSAYKAAFAHLPVDLDTQPLIQLGRAAALPRSHFRPQEELPKGPCGTVYSTNIEPDGRVYACCGPAHFSTPLSPLTLGNTKEEPLESILARGLNDPILQIIYLVGPYGLYRLLQETDCAGQYTPRKEYTTVCSLCLDMTNVPALVAAIRERANSPAGQAMLAGARLWLANKLIPDSQKASGAEPVRNGFKMLLPPRELSRAGS